MLVSPIGYKIALITLELLVLDMVITGFEAYRAGRTETFDEIYRRQSTAWHKTPVQSLNSGSSKS